MESGPGIVLFPKLLVIVIQLFMLMLFFSSSSHGINMLCICIAFSKYYGGYLYFLKSSQK